MRSRFAALCLCLVLGNAAFAQSADAPRPIDIPAQPLADALREFATQTGLQLAFQPALAAGRVSPAVKGSLTREQTLERLLAGTGLKFQFLDEHTVAVSGGEKPTGLDNSPREQESEFSAPPTAAVASSADGKNSDSKLEEVLVTGSHIRGGVAASPVITITQKDIQTSGYSTVADVVRSIPENYGGGSNPALTTNSAPNQLQQPAGGSAPNLFGLGPASTLTLVNGRRLPEGNAGAVDITPIPLEVIDRIEVVTDGSSAIYGSDAVAGVVNIILKKDFDGAMTNASLGGATQGGGLQSDISQIVGKSWHGGGAIFDYNYDHQGRVMSDQRDFTITAPRPDTLFPSMNRNSFFGSAHQDVGSVVSLFAEGYYTERELNTQITSNVGAVPYLTRGEVRQYYVTLGADLAFADSWHGTAFVSDSSQDTFQESLAGSAQAGFDYRYRGTSKTIEANADGVLLKLPSGDVRLATGAGYRKETFYQQADADGDRKVSYAFGELQVPLVAPADRPWLNRLDLSLSGRLEHYSDFGMSSVPRVGLVYTLNPEIALRGTWGRSFHAPLLDDTLASEALVMNQLADPLSVTGRSYALVRLLANSNLEPQTANTFSAGIDYNPRAIAPLHVAANYFNIHYSRIIASLSSYATALSNPADAPLVTRSPSATLQQQLIADAGAFYNFTKVAYDPALIAAIVDARPNNAAFETASGVNLNVGYSADLGIGHINSFLGATYLRLEEQLTATSLLQQLSGTVFNPPHVRARFGSTWTIHSWSLTGAVNYSGSEHNPYQSTAPNVASWTTLDGQLAYEATEGPLAGFRAALSVQNLLDKDPPYVRFDAGYPGLNYDPTNASPLGRFVSIRLTKTFGFGSR